MKTIKIPKILANLSNFLVTVFLIILIPSTIIGTYYIIMNSNEIEKNTEFRRKMEVLLIKNDSLNIELKLEKRINTLHREIIKEDTK